MNDIKNITIQADNDDHLFTKKELAEKMRISERHLQTLTKRKLIPAIMLGSAIRYDWPEVKLSLKKLTISAR